MTKKTLRRLLGAFALLAGILVAVTVVRSYLVELHFRRGAVCTKALVTEVTTHRVEELRRTSRSRHVPRRRHARTEYRIRYAYTVCGTQYTGKGTLSEPRLSPLRRGDSLAIRYAADKPSLSRIVRKSLR